MYNSPFIDELIEESLAILNEKAEVDTSPWESINDGAPKGKNVWTFSINAYPSHPTDYAKFEKNGTIIDIEDDYASAVKKVKSDFATASIIYLLP